VSYDRIAGYFRSSLFEVAGEAIARVQGPVRIICNSDLDPLDLSTAAAAQAALRRSWCASRPEEAPPSALPRYRALCAVTLGYPFGYRSVRPLATIDSINRVRSCGSTPVLKLPVRMMQLLTTSLFFWSDRPAHGSRYAWRTGSKPMWMG
jgi:hypothetical protein